MQENRWGFLLLDKPEGLTSHTATARAARALGFSKAGHAGTLDPLATGLMLVGLGRATRLLEHLVGAPKSYEALVRFGLSTSTLDREGEVLQKVEPRIFSKDELEAALAPLRGEIIQRPPAISAIKVDGVPLYRRVRRGEEVEAPLRTVTIHRLETTGYSSPDLNLTVECSSGTYIRSLARDLGEALGVPATLWGLRRTACGPFSVREAATLEELARGGDPGALKPPALMVYALPHIILEEEPLVRIIHGRVVECGQIQAECADAAVFDKQGNLAAICKVEGGCLSPRKVFWNFEE